MLKISSNVKNISNKFYDVISKKQNIFEKGVSETDFMLQARSKI